ncbi:MAG: HD domain-containing protein [candidate division Zixibacteria bacterium]|nr:HD domain-containing protein [candidate division Zixibacteria bacterium]
MIKISKDEVHGLHQWFQNYAEVFKYGKEDVRKNILLKEKHTENVCREINSIGKELDLSDDELRLSDCMALLHDVGRFEQYLQYQTFSDSISENHAELGVKVIQDYGILNSFSDYVKDLIIRAVRYHNRAVLPNDESETCIFFTKLLRDADKLDIWRVVTEYYHRKDRKINSTIELSLPDTPGFTQSVYDDVINKKIVNAGSMQNLNDFKLLQIGWVFDINFIPALKEVKSRKYVELICKVLPATDQVSHVMEVVHDFFSQKIL